MLNLFLLSLVSLILGGVFYSAIKVAAAVEKASDFSIKRYFTENRVRLAAGLISRLALSGGIVIEGSTLITSLQSFGIIVPVASLFIAGVGVEYYIQSQIGKTAAAKE